MREHQAKLMAGSFVFLEAPRWHNDRLYVSDVFDGKLYAVHENGQRTCIVEMEDRPAGIGILPDGTVVIVSCANKKLMKVSGNTLSVHADLSHIATGDLNDLTVDEDGRVYVGNFGYDLFGGAEKALTDLHLVEADGSVRIVASGLEFPNGIVITDEGRKLVVAETWCGRLTAYDRAANGDLSNRREFADLGGRQPDGICVDAEGAIWAGCYNTGEFVRVLEGGEITERIQFNGNAVSCALGGKDRKTLYCCVYLGTNEELRERKARSAIYTIEVDVPGPLPNH